MFSTMRNAWKIADLRKKILFTFLIILIFRIGAVIPVPFLDTTALKELFPSVTADSILSGAADQSTNLFSYFNALSGDAFSRATLFAMSVTPYINSSIIMQLLTVAIPALERLSKEGEEGRKKIGSITRYVTVLLAVIQGIAYYIYLRNASSPTSNAPLQVIKYATGWEAWFTGIIIVLCLTAGSALMMWLGEQINESGIGNGISILLFAGILSRLPSTVQLLIQYLRAGSQQAVYYLLVPLVILLFLAMVAFIVILNDAERRIPVQYAKRVVGRRIYGGQASHMPIKVNMSGVLPIIFASTILSIPSTVQMFVKNPSPFWQGFFNAFSPRGWLYGVLYFVLIIAFSYFYVSIEYNPVEMANNLKRNSGAIPGYRPGKPTADFIKRVISKVILMGALFLGVIAILPIIFTAVTKMNVTLGGTSLMIVVGVALETIRQIESQMMMRHYKGFLE
ncbi:MAG: preprotein translocase subunit SecY [Clostridia bacterium]|nr:preprotein translocase subunit SecY [Clostridia bacterium]